MYADELDVPIHARARNRARSAAGGYAIRQTPARAARGFGSARPATAGGAYDPAHRRRDQHAGAGKRQRHPLPGIEPQARQRHLPGAEAAGRQGKRRARHRWRGEQQRPRHAGRAAHRGADRQGRDARSDGAAGTRRCAWPRSTAPRPSAPRRISGSLVPGKSADITAIDLSALSTQPVYDPVSQIVYSATRDQVTDVWVAGKHLLADRKLTTLDENAIRQKAQAWRDKIKSLEFTGLTRFFRIYRINS